MKLKDITLIVLINLIIFIGLGVIKIWVSETAYIRTVIGLGITCIIYLIYYYKKHGTLIKQKNDTTE